jgi:hypothetical protein
MQVSLPRPAFSFRARATARFALCKRAPPSGYAPNVAFLEAATAVPPDIVTSTCHNRGIRQTCIAS